MASPYAQDITEIKTSIATLVTQMTLLKEVRDDVKALNGSMATLREWREGHVLEHQRKDKAASDLTSRLWALVIPYIPFMVIAAIFLIAKQTGLLAMITK